MNTKPEDDVVHVNPLIMVNEACNVLYFGDTQEPTNKDECLATIYRAVLVVGTCYRMVDGVAIPEAYGAFRLDRNNLEAGRALVQRMRGIATEIENKIAAATADNPPS